MIKSCASDAARFRPCAALSATKAVVLGLLLLLPALLLLNGCGGGGGGGGTSTPVGGTLTVLLRDSGNLPVDGIITLDGVSRATSAGSATFSNVTAGTKDVTILINGTSSTQSVVVTAASTSVTLTVSDTGGGVTSGTPPPPPF